MFSNWSLRRRLTLTVVVLSTLITLVIVVLILNTATSFVNKQTQDALIALNRASASALEGDLRSIEATTRAFGGVIPNRPNSILNFWQTVSLTLNEPDNIIERLGIIQPFRGNYLVNVFRRSRLEFATAPKQSNTVREIPVEFQAVTAGDATWFYSADPFGTSTTPSLIVAMYFPSTSNYVWAEIPSARLSARLDSMLDTSEYPYGMTFADVEQVFGTAGLGAAGITGSAIVRDSLLLTANEPFSYVDIAPYNERRAAYVINTPLLDGDFRLIGVISEEAVSDESDEEVLQIFFVLLVGIFVLAWLTDRFAEDLITRPVTDLTVTAQEIGSGDMRYQVGYQDRGDEVGGLARALEDMKLNLSHSYDTLSMWSRTLEKRVTERTLQLEVAQGEALNSAAEIRAVYDASLSVVSEYYLNIILNTLTGRVLGLLRASYCGIWLTTPDRTELQLVASTSEDTTRIGRTINIHEGLAGQVVQQGQLMVLDDYQGWEGRLRWIAPEMFKALAVPLMYSGEAIGAIVAGRPEDVISFSADDGRLLTLLANLVSPVVRSAQLYTQVDVAMQKANGANEVKTRFLASVTHELRTPLNLIINNMDFMRIGSFGEVNDEQRGRLDQTIRSAEHLLYLINDLLDVSKIEAGEMQLFFQPSDIRPIIEDALDSALAAMTDKPNVSLEVELPESLPQVIMDARRIRQVLLNLLTNAVKFTPAGEVRLKVAATDNGVSFSVSDTGIGIPEDELKKIFEAFERSTRAKEMGIEGTGLGLPISRYLVEAHGGSLTVETEVGKGTTFHVALPLTPPETPPAALRLRVAAG